MSKTQPLETICDLANKYHIQPKAVRAIYDKAIEEKEENPIHYTIQYVRKHYGLKDNQVLSDIDYDFFVREQEEKKNAN